MKHVNSIPLAIQEAYEIVKDSDACSDIGDLKAHGNFVFTFPCTFTIPQPNPAGLPEHVVLTAHLTDTFPHKAVEFYPDEKNEDVRGLPHHDAESGKLCLRPEYEAPCNKERLLVYVQWANQWLIDAANGNLLKPGEPFELPDFSRKSIKAAPPTELKVFTDESPTSFDAWEDRVGQTGVVELRRLSRPQGLFVYKFLTDDGECIRQTTFSLARSSANDTLRTRWLLLPTVISSRHRPAQFYHELFALCTDANISLKKNLKKAWVAGSKTHPYSLLLVGFPISATVGEQFSEVHWQPLLLPNKDATKRAVTWKKGKQGEGRVWHHALNDGPFSREQPLHWGKTENLSRQRQYARGALSQNICNQSIAVLGCGALGSLVAESFCRSGVREMALFDEQLLEYGNLCRHTLDGRDAGRTKAAALADRLASTSMTTRISAHSLHVPWSKSEAKSAHAKRAFENSAVLIDCTTDHSAFVWMSRFAKRRRVRLASMFINPHATILTLVLSGKQTSANRVFRSLMASIEQNSTPIDADAYFSELSDADAVLPGAGCWHGTFPALNTHIWLLACAAVQQIASWLENDQRCDGLGILIQRNASVDAGPIVETIWRQLYR